VDLEADLRALLLVDLMEHTEYPQDLDALDTRKLLGLYANWANRFPPVQPRSVHQSRELGRLLSGSGVLASDARNVLAELEAGANIEYRLSEDVDVAWVPPSEPKRKRLRQLDRYFAAWGIHHLHLGAPDFDTGRARSSHLLYVVFVDDHVYALAVFPHGEWHRDRLLHIGADNWPDGGPLLTSKSVVGLEREFSEPERADLFQANIAAPFARNGRVYSARDNVSVVGTSLGAGDWANQTDYDLVNAIERLTREPQKVTAAMQRRYPTLTVGSTTWSVEIKNKAFAVVDISSGAYLLLEEVSTVPA